MLLATLALLIQMPLTAAQSAAAPPEITLEKSAPAAQLQLFATAAPSDFFDRDNIRLVDLPSPSSDTANDKTSTSATPPNADLDNATLLAEVHIPTEIEPPSPDFHPPHIAAERPAHTWLALSALDHGAATFDAWTTRRAIEQGHVEMNPMLKPFAGNASIYAAIQVGPFLLDYLGRKMEYSDKRWMRRAWWLPQTLSAACSLFAGSHNLSVTK